MRLIYWFNYLFIVEFAAIARPISSLVCPEWCECVTSGESSMNNEDEIKVTCEWSDLTNVRFLPSQLVSRLTITCKNNSSTPTKLHAGMFDSFVKLRHLSIINCHLDHSDLPRGVLNNLSSLKTFHLQNLSTNDDTFVVESNSLSTLKSLEKLTITSTTLKKLPSSELCSLKELKSLNLSANSLTSIEDIGLFDGQCQNQIVILDLDKNKISKIDNGSLNDFVSLRILRLNENLLRQIPSETFKRTKQLRQLYLSGNKLSNVDDLPLTVNTLDLSNNNLHIIPPVLSRHAAVQHLNFSRNYVDVNTPFVFETTNQLISLDLSYNKLHSIPASFFSFNSSSFQELYLNNNDMRSLPPSAFKNLTNLRRLDLSENKLSLVDRRQFDGVVDLEELMLDGNVISKLDDNFFASISRLIKLGLSRNVFIDVPKSFVALRKLRELDMSKNSISSIHQFLFVNLENLTDLNLSGNKLTTIERNTFEKIVKLQNLDVSDNAIERISMNCLEGDVNLVELRLQKNLIRDINGALANLQRLNLLNLSDNRINHLDLALLPHNLNILLASNNSISQLTNFLPTIRTVNLRRVDFSFNKLEKLTSVMLPSSLESANFSHNDINKLEADVLNDRSILLSLDLSHNKIQTINQSSIIVKSSTTNNNRHRFILYLKENPFECTCNTQWMKSAYAGSGNEVLFNGVPLIVDFDRITCKTLQSNVFRSINNVSSNEFLCTYTTYCSEDCNCCEFEFCDCKNVCPNGCSCYVDSTSTVNNVQCTSNSFGESTVIDEIQLRSIPMHATSVRLDGVRLARLSRNAFFGRYRLKQLYLNDSSIKDIASKAFSGLTSLELLDLSDNSLATLTGDEFSNTPKLETLFLNGNKFETLETTAFTNLPMLKYLTLHNNKFKTLPVILTSVHRSLTALTLGGNPWKCDCDDKYLIQTWLPRHVYLVVDQRTIYCFENLTESRLNSSTILAVLPATSSNDVVKVNFWTFVNEINQTFCYPKRREYELDDDSASSDNLFDSALIFIPVGLCAIFLLTLIAVVVWRFRIRLRKNFYNKYHRTGGVGGDSTIESSLHSTNTTPTTPTPLLQYDAFVSYSKQDEDFVENEIVPQLEHVHPYYKLCLLHREFPASQEFSDRQYVKDELIKAMGQSQRIITVCTSNFLNHEWELVHIRTAYRYLLKIKPRQSFIMILLQNELPKSKDDVLEHYLRISQCYKWTDKSFWTNFLQSMPDEPSNNATDGYANSSHYSDLYGGSVPTTTTTIVPSQLI